MVDPGARAAAKAAADGGAVKPTAPTGPSFVASAGRWPFSLIVDELVGQLASPIWHVRHGAALSLRSILGSQGGSGGKVAGASSVENARDQTIWASGVARALLDVLALDRFVDFVGDHAVAPVREAASMALASLAPHLQGRLLGDVRSALLDMASRRAKTGWQMRHAGLLGLKHVVAIGGEVLEGPDLLRIVDAAVLGCVGPRNEAVLILQALRRRR